MSKRDKHLDAAERTIRMVLAKTRPRASLETALGYLRAARDPEPVDAPERSHGCYATHGELDAHSERLHDLANTLQTLVFEQAGSRLKNLEAWSSTVQARLSDAAAYRTALDLRVMALERGE